MASPFTLAVCAHMQFVDLPFLDRITTIGSYGVAVELWDWTTLDLDAIAATGVPVESMTGYIRGNLTDDDGIEEFLATAEESARASTILGKPRLNIHGTGLGEGGLPVRPVGTVTGPMWARAALTLHRLAEIAEQYDVVYEMENLNLAVDHPGTPFAGPDDILALIEAVDSPRLKLNLDLYHAQIDQGDLTETCRRALPHLGEIQVADVPGRCEPGTGEINYRHIARALDQMGYRGTIALEGWARTDSHTAITTFIETFSNLERTDGGLR